MLESVFFVFAVIIPIIKKREEKTLITENYMKFLCKCTDTSIAHNSMLFFFVPSELLSL